MRKEHAVCRNCRHWREGAPSDMRAPVSHAEGSDTGVCECGPASMYEMNGEWVAFQPIVHATRSCDGFSPPRPTSGGDGGPDRDGGEPIPEMGQVRTLFPVRSAELAA